MGIVITLLIGLVVGVLAKFLMPGKDPGGFITTICIGVAGSFLAGWIGRTVGLYREPLAGPGLIGSVLGAMLLLLAYRLATRGRATA